MSPNFRTETLTDAERCRRAAEWLQAGILDVARALDLVRGLSAEAEVELLRSTLAAQADLLRAKSRG